MNEGKSDRKVQSTKTNSRYQRERRKRRRRKRILRLSVTLLAIAAVCLIFICGRLLGTKLISPVMSGDLRISWGFGVADIVLDAGHGGKDQGAASRDAIEKEITLSIAKKTEEILKKAGYKVKMVREDDTFLELEERVEYANRREAKVFVSIHCNSSEDGEGNGIETFYCDQKGDGSQQLAQSIQENVVEQTGARDREIKSADYAVVVGTKMPAALVETGFLNNSQERELLQQEDYQEKLARGIAEGILTYLEQQNQE